MQALSVKPELNQVLLQLPAVVVVLLRRRCLRALQVLLFPPGKFFEILKLQRFLRLRSFLAFHGLEILTHFVHQWLYVLGHPLFPSDVV